MYVIKHLISPQNVKNPVTVPLLEFDWQSLSSVDFGGRPLRLGTSYFIGS